MKNVLSIFAVLFIITFTNAQTKNSNGEIQRHWSIDQIGNYFLH